MSERRWVRLDVAAPGEGEVVAVACEGRELCLSRVSGRLGALDDACPHQGAPLSAGLLDGDGKLVCPRHGWAFDPVTGDMDGGAGIGADAFPVELRDDGVWVGLPGKR